MHQLEEELLILAAQDGDQKSFNIIFQRNHKALLRYAFKVCGDKALAQDAVQEAWLKLAKNIRSLNDPRAFKAWLYQLVHWSCIDSLRANKHTREHQSLPDDIPASADSDETEQQAALKIAINRLPATEKQMIHLFYLDELAVKEIALVLKIAEGTVKSRLNRARRLLKERFEN